jgi:hypothetical protein
LGGPALLHAPPARPLDGQEPRRARAGQLAEGLRMPWAPRARRAGHRWRRTVGASAGDVVVVVVVVCCCSCCSKGRPWFRPPDATWLAARGRGRTWLAPPDVGAQSSELGRRGRARSKERAGGSRACGREGHQRRLCASERCVGGSVAQTAEGVSMVGGGGGAFDGMVWTEFLCAWGASAERDGNSQASKEAVRPFACPPHGPLLDPSDPIPHASDLDHVKGLDHTHPHARTHTHTQTQALAAELLKTQTRERSFPSPQSSS